jgi:hypothetical protein
MSKSILTHEQSLAVFLQVFAWSLSFLVSFIAIFAWGTDFGWHIPFNAYIIFPLLGLLAYSLMWSHYVAAAFRQILNIDRLVLKFYFEFTSFLVLVLICLHPGLLILQRYRDGFGLPPGSYESYVAPGLGWITLLGTASLLVFLAYELRRVFGKRAWWKHMQTASDIAMLAIFYHGLKLGHQIHGWFRAVWWFYGIALVLILARTYFLRYTDRKTKPGQGRASD